MNSVSVLVFATIIGSTFGAMAIGPAQIDPSQPDKCLDTGTGQHYAIGQSWQLDGCGMSTCSRRNISGTPQLMVEYTSCGVVMVDPPCYLKEDKTAAYPDCCPQPECPEDYSTEQQETEHAHQLHQQQDGENGEEADDFLNEIEDDENGDSMYNHKYNNKLVDEQLVADPSRITKDQDQHQPDGVYASDDSTLKKVNNDRYRNILGQDQFRDSEEPTLQQRNAAYLQALQDELLRYYPTLRRASPRFDFLSSDEFKDDHFQWF